MPNELINETEKKVHELLAAWQETIEAALEGLAVYKQIKEEN